MEDKLILSGFFQKARTNQELEKRQSQDSKDMRPLLVLLEAFSCWIK